MERNGTTNGFVFGACGPEYTKLANTAAKSLRGVAPDANIDLFTDCADEVEDGIFDQCHELNRSWFRPKFEAMIRSRFEKTIYADCDTYFCADVSDIFEVLDHADFAAVQVIRNNMKFNLTQWRTKLPLAVPRYNCGLIGIRNTPKVIEFLQNVEKIILEEDL